MKLSFPVLFLLFVFQISNASSQESTSGALEKLETAVEQGQFSEVPMLIAKAQENGPKLTKNQIDFVTAVEYFMNEEPTSSNDLLARLFESNKSNAIRSLYVRSLAASGKTDEAFVIADAQELSKRSSASWTLIASLHLSNNQFQMAERAATSALETNATYPDALFFRGFARWQMNNIKAALSDFEAAHAIRPSGPFRNEATPYLLSGMYYANQDSHALAISSFESALNADQRSLQANLGLWKVYSKTSQHLKALTYAENLARLAPESSDSITSNARTLMSLSKIGEAVPYLNQWYRKSPQDPILNQLLAHAYSAKSDYSKAFYYASRSKDFAPLQRPTRSTFVKMGVQLAQSDQLEGSGIDKTRLQNEICITIKQLCIETDWNRKSYLVLALKAFELFEQTEDANEVKQYMQRIAKAQSASPTPTINR
jgi:tetratricopeptide (TPR) repeat protein